MGDSGRGYRLWGGTIVDPANPGLPKDRDLWIRDGRILSAPVACDDVQFHPVDCRGRWILPGGIDLHSHFVGPKVNLARRMQPELFQTVFGPDQLSGPEPTPGNRIVPVVGSVGLQYTGMGYTTIMDAAVTPLAARMVHAELEQLPLVDAGFYLLGGNHHRLLECAARQDVGTAARFLSWLLRRCGGYAPKLVNPGGVELWKQHRDGNARDLDQIISSWNTTPRKILHTLTAAANQLRLPHPVHIHCNNLGLPGNWQTTLETMRTLDGLTAHFAHVQFHSYGGEDPARLRSRTTELIDWINAHPEHSVDAGQVLFGRTTSMTADGPLGHWLAELNGARWFSSDVEVESGCGISPIEYRDRDLLNAVQWATGLEWYLGVRNPWQVVMSTDHPNGGSFLAYPEIIQLLMDREYRREKLEQLSPRLKKRTRLAELDREYTLDEIAIITRAGPARLLGLVDKGHLGPGAVADVAIHSASGNIAEAFALPWMVFKSGVPVLADGQQRLITRGSTHILPNALSGAAEDEEFSRWFRSHYSLQAMQLGRHTGADQFSRPLITSGS